MSDDISREPPGDDERAKPRYATKGPSEVYADAADTVDETVLAETARARPGVRQRIGTEPIGTDRLRDVAPLRIEPLLADPAVGRGVAPDLLQPDARPRVTMETDGADSDGAAERSDSLLAGAIPTEVGSAGDEELTMVPAVDAEIPDPDEPAAGEPASGELATSGPVEVGGGSEGEARAQMGGAVQVGAIQVSGGDGESAEGVDLEQSELEHSEPEASPLESDGPESGEFDATDAESIEADLADGAEPAEPASTEAESARAAAPLALGSEQDEAEAPPLSDTGEIARVAFALLLTQRDGAPIVRLAEACGTSSANVKLALDELDSILTHNGLPLEVSRTGDKVQILTKPEVFPYVQKLKGVKRNVQLSPAALETLAVIAYRQPVIRAEIESIRGVKAGPMLRSLLEHKLVKVVGRADVPGRPLQYGTTQVFLERFGLESLKELPSIQEFKSLG